MTRPSSAHGGGQDGDSVAGSHDPGSYFGRGCIPSRAGGQGRRCTAVGVLNITIARAMVSDFATFRISCKWRGGGLRSALDNVGSSN